MSLVIANATPNAIANPNNRFILNSFNPDTDSKHGPPTLGEPTSHSTSVHTLRCARNSFGQTRGTTPSFPPARLQNIGVNLVVKRPR